MMKFSLSGVKSEMLRLKLEMDALMSNHAVSEANRLKSALEEVTPVDTGRAKASWSVVKTPYGADIISGIAYMRRLNEGWSKQAPAFFVERTALKFGTPKGAIVEPD